MEDDSDIEALGVELVEDGEEKPKPHLEEKLLFFGCELIILHISLSGWSVQNIIFNLGHIIQHRTNRMETHLTNTMG